MTIQQRITKILSSIVIAGLCITPEMMSAATQQNAQGSNTQSQSDAQATPATAQDQNQQPQPDSRQNRGTTVDPSQGPLQPVTTYPDASQQQQNEPQNATEPAQPATTTTTTEQVPEAPQPKKPQEPVGAAAAEKVPTAGGAASKPAGIAIAPAKQHQTRSLLLKIGAIAAAGVAAGTVYALSRGTPSTPPNTNTAGATQK